MPFSEKLPSSLEYRLFSAIFFKYFWVMGAKIIFPVTYGNLTTTQAAPECMIFS